MRILLTILVAALAPQDAPPGLSREEFEKVFELCKPKPTEAAWDKLPWETNVWTAVTKAAKERKLVLVWSAGGGGHPLGMC